jgi:hypothetical protein
MLTFEISFYKAILTASVFSRHYYHTACCCYVFDNQAQARCHRIGQQKAVKVYRLITRNTYEREMFDRASLKLGLDKAVLQSMGTKELNTVSMSVESKAVVSVSTTNIVNKMNNFSFVSITFIFIFLFFLFYSLIS